MQQQVKPLIKGVSGSEGPCISRDGRVFMVEPSSGQIVEVLEGLQRREHANTGGIPAGLQIDRNNDIWVADMKLGIFRVTMNGEVIHEVADFEGAPIRGCNDCYFDSLGNLYFTAPAGSNAEQPVGEVYCRLGDGQVHRLDSGFAFSNGLALTADDKTLIVAETFTKRLYAYDIIEPGAVANKRLWATLPATGKYGPDGMDFDRKGRLLVAHFGGSAVEVYMPDGTFSHSLSLPFEQVTNVHFRGPGSTTLLITESSEGGLWELEFDTPGQMQYGWG
jgi:gluconolactonase